ASELNGEAAPPERYGVEHHRMDREFDRAVRDGKAHRCVAVRDLTKRTQTVFDDAEQRDLDFERQPRTVVAVAGDPEAGALREARDRAPQRQRQTDLGDERRIEMIGE